MAASSSSGGHWEYDVFLSFRGEDTRKTFVCHLYKALEQKAIRTFIDSEGLRKGNKISELLTAIECSRISVVVLSQNYASSTWCLKEVVKIMECNDHKQQIVVPIFYEVDPSDIRKLKNQFGEALAKHEENPNLDREEVKRWRTALSRIADLSGWDSRKYQDDVELIEKIVGDIIEKWIHIPRPSSLANNLVGMDHHIKEVSSRLCRGKNDVGVVGIWGMGGLGKTTIARAVYDKIVHQFEHSCFLYNVKERFAKSKDEAKMRGELLSMILKGNVQGVDIFNEGASLILERLGKKRVLVVLDDVETSSQIGALLGDYYSFGDGSRILLTTRDKESLAGVIETYEPRCLNHNESLELFMKHAFGVNQPSEEYSGLSERAIEYAQGLPLALEVLGSSLYQKSIHQWKNLLEKIKKIPDRKILDVLRTSFEGLDESEKNIFLDIACLFKGWVKHNVIELLQSFGFFPDIGLKVLVDRALITLSYRVNMHDLLQEMGRDIVRLEDTKEPGRRSRLWSQEDVYHVLTQNTATDAVECLMLDLSNSKVDLCINSEALVRMRNLRLLIIYSEFYNIFGDGYFEEDGSIEFIWPVDGCKQLAIGNLESLSHELRFLLWHGCPLKSLSSNFIPKNLVRLDMRGSHIRELWEGMQPLQNLKTIMLSHCQYLVKIPDLTEAINLEGLFLNGCSSLCELHSSISALQKLHFLNLRGCKELMILPSSIHMKSLESLDISGCSNLEKFPGISDGMTMLIRLSLAATSIKELPSSINNLSGLEELDLEGCTELKSLPICNRLRSLLILNLKGCSSLETFPEISGIMGELYDLLLDGTAIKGLPSSIDLLEGLQILSMRNCKSLEFLPASIYNLKDLTCLDLSGCSALHNLPEKFGDLKSFICLETLEELNLEGCTELKSLPIFIHLSSLQTLNLKGCSSLEKFPEISGIMKELSKLLLDGTAIKGLPSSIGLLDGLKKLTMRNCKSLEFLPASICNLTNLTRLDLSGCSALHNLPEKFGDLKSLTCLKAQGSGVKHFPLSILRLKKQLKIFSSDVCKEMVALFSSISSSSSSWSSLIKFYGFSCLVHLDLSDCNLMVLPDGIADLSSLKTLKLCSNNLESLPVTMDQLGCLARLELEACKRLKSIPELSSIIHIDADCCTALETISTPKIDGRSVDFRFSNCFRMPHTVFRDIVETHALHQDNHLRLLCFNMCLPGSEVPEWFNFRDMGCSSSLHVPPDSFNNKLLGFAICIAINFGGAHHDVSNIYARCSFTSGRNHGEQFNRFDVLRQSGTQRFLKSDHLFMAYIPWIRYSWITEDGSDAFKIVVEIGTYSPTEDRFTNSFGVRLIYANHEETQNRVTQTIIHVDGQSIEDAAQQMWGCCNEGEVTGLGTPFFPDQLEIRKSDTDLEAESSESGEGRGMCQTLELLTEPQKESEEEEEMTVVVEQGEGCWVLGSTCCCLSLSECTMPLRRKETETEREGDSVPRIADDGEISELGSHSGLVVPDSQDEGKDEEEMMGEECLAVRRLLGPLSSCFSWLGYLWHPRIRHRKIEVAEAEDYVVS